jgi:hypothetical protein
VVWEGGERKLTPYPIAPGRAHSLGGESPLHTRQGEVLAERQRLRREAESGGSCGQSAGLTNRKRIEATHRGETAKIVKARYLHGTVRRISDRHKREGECVIPGEVWRCAAVLRGSRGPRRHRQKSAEAVVGREAEGPNDETESRTDDLEADR